MPRAHWRGSRYRQAIPALRNDCSTRRQPSLGEAGPWFLMLTLYLRAILAVRRGSFDEALGFVRESLTRVRDLHDKFAFVYALVPLAAVAGLKGDDAWAARILGARDVVAERTGAAVVDKSVHDLTEQAGREVRARLGPDRWAQAYAVGRMSSIDALLKDVDRALGQTASTTRWNRGAAGEVISGERRRETHQYAICQVVFIGAGVWGIVVLTPLDWLVDVTGRHTSAANDSQFSRLPVRRHGVADCLSRDRIQSGALLAVDVPERD